MTTAGWAASRPPNKSPASTGDWGLPSRAVTPTSRAGTPMLESRPNSRNTINSQLPLPSSLPVGKRAKSPGNLSLSASFFANEEQAAPPSLLDEDSRPGSAPSSAPTSHAQRVAELHYDQFCIRRLNLSNRRGIGSYSMPAPRRRKKNNSVTNAWSKLPSSWRPAAFEVEVEMRQTGFDFNEALAALVVGRDSAQCLATHARSTPNLSTKTPQDMRAYQTTSTTPSRFRLVGSRRLPQDRRMGQTPTYHRTESGKVFSAEGALDVRALLAEFPHDLPGEDKLKASRAVAAAGLLQGNQWSSKISTIQMDGMDLEEAPDTLHLLPDLTALSLNGSAQLQSITSLRKCGELRSVDLSGCPRLLDLRTLGVLPYLEVLDLSRCIVLEDIRPLLVSANLGGAEQGSPNRSPSISPVKKGAWMRIGTDENQDGDDTTYSSKRLGHPSLRWLSVCDCASLRKGVSDLAQCPALTYVDLFGCQQADPTDCFKASQALGSKCDFIWPSLSILETAARAHVTSASHQNAITASAANAIAAKLAVARTSRPVPAGTVGLAALTEESQRVAMTSATCAAIEMGIEQNATHESFLEGLTKNGVASCTPAESRKGSKSQKMPCAPPRIGPVDLARAAHAVGFQTKNGVDISDIFRNLDVDCDGGLTMEELLALETGPPHEPATSTAIELLIRRKGGSLEAAAADLAAGRATVDKSRIQECFIVAGINEASASRIAHAIIHCTRGVPKGTDVEAAMLRALGGFALASSTYLLANFKDHLRSRFPRCEDAFWVLTESRQGNVEWDEFQRRVMNPIRWPAASTPGALGSVFRAIDVGDNGRINAEAFHLLEVFDADAVMAALSHAGHLIKRGSAGGAPDAFCVDEDSVLFDDRSLTRSQFATAWEELGDPCQVVDGRIVFGLLDVCGSGQITSEELCLLSDALPRRAEAAAAGALEVLFKKRFGSLEEMHALLRQKDSYTLVQAPTGSSPERSQEFAGRRRSSARKSKSVSVSSRSTKAGVM